MNARKEIYDKNDFGVYHCFSRCVRRSFLCGEDEYTGKNYDHRKFWIEELLEIAAQGFVIDILSFSVMDNHFHVMLGNRPDLRNKLSPMAVARRWLLLFPKRRDEHGLACEPTFAEIKVITDDTKRINKLRDRLGDISWLMGYVKWRVARRANLEDKVTGTFFEKRFEMRRLLTDNAVLACSIYVDLNPIRAEIAETPEASVHTSAYRRIQGAQARKEGKQSKQAMADRWLAPIHHTEVPKNQQFAGKNWRASDKSYLPFTFEQYLNLLDWSGRQSQAGKSGKIPDDLAPILERLEINSDRWLDLVQNFHDLFRRIAGTADSVKRHAASHEHHWFHGIQNCREIFELGEDE